jgi:outer membrane receptor protein involved in Fe transport
MNRILLTISMLFVFISISTAQTSLEGKVKETDSGEPILFGTVVLFKNGVIKANVETDIDGNYFFSDIQPGTYDVEMGYVGYKTKRINGVICKAGQTTRLNIEMEPEGTLLNEVVITEYKVPLIEIDNTTQGTTITSEKIDKLPQKSINAIVANAAGVSSTDGGAVSVRGSRSNETIVFIDGIRSRGLIPQSEVDQLQLVTGGIEAKYGDVTGGIISLTTKGPSKKFTAGIEAETSEGLDGFGYNLLNANFAGPILKNKKGESVIGYRFSGQFTDILDGSPSAVGVYRAPLSVIQELEKNPFYNVGTSILPSAEKLRNGDIGEKLKARPTDGNQNLNLTGKLDFRLSSAIDLSISGNYETDKDRFVPNNPNNWAIFNWHNNPYNYTTRQRVNVRFKHKLGGQSEESVSAEGKKGNNQLIRNISYQFIGGYEKARSRSEDLRHEDRLFNYGYSGIFPQTYEPVFIRVRNDQGLIYNYQLGYNRVSAEFIPNTEINPVLGMYGNESNGIIRQDRSQVWTNLFSNVGQVYNTYNKTESDLYTFNFSSGFDLVPGSSEKGRHSVQFGMIYEQTVDRAYALSPIGLWRAGEIIQNSQLSLAELDRNAFKGLTAAGDSLFFPVRTEDKEDKFFYKVREKLNVGEKEFVNINQMTPDQLSLDMFSSRELTDNSLVSYRGYDYLGNKTTGNISFEDFFTAKDADGRRSHPVAPFSPIYAAGYIQDKFSYKDIIFRLGVRADYYDANTKVFKDPYAPYEIQDAKQFFTENSDKKQPASIADNYKVYVAGPESNEVIGYRQGDQWFRPNGEAVSDGSRIFNGGVVYPKYVGEKDRVLDLQDPNFRPEYSFEDYKPQLNFMPRLAFSFPISEEAGFFTHYDVLYQRPPSNSTLTALNYFYWNNASSGVQNNPNLRPIRTVSYEAGFQQKVSNFSAMKVSAYYKENKDLIQRRVYTNIPAPIGQYETYGNLDFGTIKGFTFQFDRRRKNNLEFVATYTLQFADGSGSDANSSNGINNRGILRVLNPLSVDERHRITTNFDYRFGGGKKYDGPKIGDLKILANTGINLNAIAVSGQPFTRSAIPSPRGGNGYLGSINGSRQPWTFSMDARIDRDIKVNLTGKDGGKPLTANIYFRVQNVLDARNVNSLFSYTGDPENDGYLLSSFGAARLKELEASGKNRDAFYEAYSWYLLAPGNYTLPRRMYIGAIINL